MDREEKLRQLRLARQPKPKKVKKPIAKKSAKKLKAESEEKKLRNGDESLQDKWFEDRMRENLPVCMNCGMEANWLLQPEYKLIWRACQAHVVPKRKTMFPSVALHPLNHMVLFPVWGGHLCGCHDEYDASWFQATTMKVWDIAVHRFKEFEKMIDPKERRRIPEQFLLALNPSNIDQ